MSLNTYFSKLANRVNVLGAKAHESRMEFIRGLDAPAKKEESKCVPTTTGFQVVAGKDQFGPPKAK